jgi:hypothetical protein
VCDGSAPEASAEDAAVTCAATVPGVSFARDVAPVLGGCTGELCHGPWYYSNTVNVPAPECCDGRKLIWPGHPERSYLLQKLIGSSDLCAGSSMPLDYSLDQPTLDAIASWICLGAPNN